MNATVPHAFYALAWLSFGLGHSLLAGTAAKKRLVPVFGAYYRLTYNLFAGLHIALVFAAGRHLFAASGFFELTAWAWNVLPAVQVIGWAAFLWALRGYDLGLLAGTRQVRNHVRGLPDPGDEPLCTDGLHRYVRHPLYAGVFLIVWGRVGNEFDLATAVWASLYLVIGAFFEERKLLRLYGEIYADYCKQVPAFIPWKGRRDEN